ncbi:30S ribosomal protein S20 [Alphaproteobacteria bacterium]|jgi:small subunit ribosomal protein S20|nr:30S ribosomal protein S20 [Rhodobiaceae bacterium]MBL6641330.1 30S ribosomal protein S20 [PS1 clade bacterium]MCH1487260.1 30S ribosomal protein S20 [Alphaproteobacteria bacterium]RPF97707.1 MAG: 30S ribosomal protein S20 [Rhizobiales bacterium TMED162]MBL6783770.1 30S ribosomal protein S20 [PS1 clade bacterium]|tara:strand:- start:37 stop:297 length:261 start_codon:yes stop_codon:yes gene_type:complete
MANTSSAKKMVRKIERRTARNRDQKTRMRTFIRRVDEAIAGGDKAAAETALRAAQPVIARAGQKGLMHKKTASRKISRLSKRVSTI